MIMAQVDDDLYRSASERVRERKQAQNLYFLVLSMRQSLVPLTLHPSLSHTHTQRVASVSFSLLYSYSYSHYWCHLQLATYCFSRLSSSQCVAGAGSAAEQRRAICSLAFQMPPQCCSCASHYFTCEMSDTHAVFSCMDGATRWIVREPLVLQSQMILKSS